MSEWAGRRVGFYCFHSSHSSTGTGNGFAVPPPEWGIPNPSGQVDVRAGRGAKIALICVAKLSIHAGCKG